MASLIKKASSSKSDPKKDQSKTEGTTTTYGQNTNLAASPSPANNAVAFIAQDVVIKVAQQTTENAGVLTNNVWSNFSKMVSNSLTSVVARGSVMKSKDDQEKALTEAQKVDLSISIKSKVSESVEMNTLKIPDLNINLVYNFFEGAEEDIEQSEDQSRDPLLKNKPIDVPRYVEMKWDVVSVTELLTGTEKKAQDNKDLRNKAFVVGRGTLGFNSTNFKNSVQKRKKDANVINKDGISTKITDVHDIEKGFGSIGNHKAFPNTISATVNTEGQKNILSKLPFTVIRKK